MGKAVMGPLRLWLASIALQRRGHRRLAGSLQRLNTLLYGNSLSARASVGPKIWLGHHAFGIVVHDNVEIGRQVTLWHNCSLEVRGDAATRLVLEDEVNVGANAVILTPPGRSLRIGRGARIGAGAVVTRDVPPGATVVAARTRLIEGDARADEHA
jgi:serine O-acetyltransferase